MKKSFLILFSVVILSACQSREQVQADRRTALEKEHQMWSEFEKSSKNECPINANPKMQIARQDCLEALIRRDVSPYVSYPHLVDYMLGKMRAEAEKYAAGKINKKTYTKNAEAVSRDYWNHWEKVWDTNISSAKSNPFEGLGDVLLVGVQTTGTVLQDHQQAARENAVRNKPVQCIVNGYTATCN